MCRQRDGWGGEKRISFPSTVQVGFLFVFLWCYRTSFSLNKVAPTLFDFIQHCAVVFKAVHSCMYSSVMTATATTMTASTTMMMMLNVCSSRSLPCGSVNISIESVFFLSPGWTRHEVAVAWWQGRLWKVHI